MRRRRWWLVVAAGVALAGGLTLLPRVRRRRRGHLRLVALVLAMLPRIESPDLSVENIASSITGFFAAVVQFIVGDIITPIASALSWLGQHLVGYVADQWRTLLNVIGAIPVMFGTVADWITSVAEDAARALRAVTDSLYGNVLNWVHVALSVGGALYDVLASVVTAIVTAALRAGGDILGGLADALNTLLNGALEVGNWLWHRIVTIAEAVVRDALAVGGAIYSAMGDIVAQLIRDWLTVGGWLLDLLDGIIRDIVAPLLDGIADVLPDALKFIVDNFDRLFRFLVFVIEHPLSWFEDWATQLLEDGGALLIDVIGRAVESNEARVEDIADRLFG